MIWFWVVALVLIIGASAVIIAGRGDAMTDVYEDRPDVTVDRGPLTAADVAKVRFTTAVRGYRMDEVDAFVERLEADLRARTGEPLADEVESGDANDDTVTRPGGPDHVPAVEASAPRASQPSTRTRGNATLPDDSDDPAGETSR
ncbi:MAG: DivIVA domain-containing protein [Actinomycetota bacterium]|nr:DivIVA domain-containing protein [Actinomycetota bacterium]